MTKRYKGVKQPWLSIFCVRSLVLSGISLYWAQTLEQRTCCEMGISKKNYLKSHINLLLCKFWITCMITNWITSIDNKLSILRQKKVQVLLPVFNFKFYRFTSALLEMFYTIYLPLLNFSMSFNMNLYNSHRKEDLMNHCPSLNMW